MHEVSFLLGVAVAIGAVVALAVRIRGGRTLAVLAGAAALLAWLVFNFDWLTWSLSENGPSYYAFSDYEEYRRALRGRRGLLAGTAYSVLAGSVVVAASLLRGRIGEWWAPAALAAACVSIALPALVPALLERVEYGKDPVFYFSRGGVDHDPISSRPNICFAYGVERPEDERRARAPDPEVCVQFRRTPASLALLRDPAPASGDALTIYDILTEMNEREFAPYATIDGLGIDGLEIARADWTGTVSARDQIPLAPPTEAAKPTDDAETKRNVVQLAAHMQACGRDEGDFVPCAADPRLRSTGIPVGTSNGQVYVTAVTTDSYEVSGQSASGNLFALRHDGPHRRQRLCASRGHGACPASGRW